MPTIPISRFLNARMAYGPRFSSDGQRLAFLTDITGVPQVWQVPLGDDLGQIPWPDQLTFASDRVMYAEYSPAPGDDRLIYTRDLGGNEKAQIFLSDGSASDVNLTAGHEDAMHIPGEWSGDGQRILFAANRRHPGLFDLYLQPLDGEARLVWQNDVPGYLRDAHFAPDGQHAVVARVFQFLVEPRFAAIAQKGANAPPGFRAREVMHQQAELFAHAAGRGFADVAERLLGDGSSPSTSGFLA